MMTTDMNRLRGKMAERRVTQEDLSKRIGIDSSTFSRKINSEGLSFTVGQMHQIVDALHMTVDEAKEIFLWPDSH